VVGLLQYANDHLLVAQQCSKLPLSPTRCDTHTHTHTQTIYKDDLSLVAAMSVCVCVCVCASMARPQCSGVSQIGDRARLSFSVRMRRLVNSHIWCIPARNPFLPVCVCVCVRVCMCVLLGTQGRALLKLVHFGHSQYQ